MERPVPDRSPVGVLVMAYGTPATPADIEAYYTHVRRGRAPTGEQLFDLRRRYAAIGGTSPLLARTRAQVDGVASILGPTYLVGMGMKHAPPFIEDAMADFARRGVAAVVGVVLAPHFSSMSVGEYARRAVAAGEAAGVAVATVHSWHLAPGFVDMLAAGVEVELARMTANGAMTLADIEVVFSAHSLPERVLATGDRYPEQLRETAEAVALRVGISRWRIGWQSAGRTSDPWIGPDILEIIPSLRDEGAKGVLVCPAGFVSDHLEVLYDLDIEARKAADELGLAFARTPSPNDHPALCGAVADEVRAVARVAGLV